MGNMTDVYASLTEQLGFVEDSILKLARLDAFIIKKVPFLSENRSDTTGGHRQNLLTTYLHMRCQNLQPGLLEPLLVLCRNEQQSTSNLCFAR